MKCKNFVTVHSTFLDSYFTHIFLFASTFTLLVHSHFYRKSAGTSTHRNGEHRRVARENEKKFCWLQHFISQQVVVLWKVAWIVALWKAWC